MNQSAHASSGMDRQIERPSRRPMLIGAAVAGAIVLLIIIVLSMDTSTTFTLDGQRIRIATAVAWFYEGEGGAFEYWPEGPGAAPARIDAPLDNRAVVGDNDVMFHRVATVGDGGENHQYRLSALSQVGMGVYAR